ncbi:DUF1934 domain-containing protein [Velocimicrobium porci]|uniref:DUF1934 domain-containing protein n=1 Tax=Velocimicrobium porci TaxID=2606634 RepID=A0A6L5XXL1_9FIRM|nr:DUF1934 domain-containing protein [Velocimicrobium porci]MSS63277.1 DUF1934 domain-containing protein [Velocimicrobium porci]
MNKKVLVSISGLQTEIGDDEAIEIVSPGEYHQRDGKHYILYEEMHEDGEAESGVSKNLLKISPDYIELTKKGYANVNMVFEKDKKTMTYYQTPFGNLLIGLYTTNISIIEQKEGMIATIDYSLDINYDYVTDCNIKIKVMDRAQ